MDAFEQQIIPLVVANIPASSRSLVELYSGIGVLGIHCGLSRAKMRVDCFDSNDFVEESFEECTKMLPPVICCVFVCVLSQCACC